MQALLSICASEGAEKAFPAGATPDAQLVVDLFHVVQLAVKMTGDVRRRVVRQKYGRTPSGLAIPDLSWTASRLGLVPVRDAWLDDATAPYLTVRDYIAPWGRTGA
jgi:hypothetical protein